MLNVAKVGIAGIVLLCLAACSLPRGAALQQEITLSQSNEDAPFQVVQVERNNVQTLSAWPVTGWHGHYHWFDSHVGSASNVIRPGDQLVLTVWDNQEPSLLLPVGMRMTTMPPMTVTPRGTIFVPYLDDISVSGLTPDAARRKLQTEIEIIAPSAQVQLGVQAGQQNTVDAVRGFAQPQVVPLPDRNFSILSLISAAGGIMPGLRNPLVRIIRGGTTYEIRSDTLLENARQNVRLQGGDKVIIDEDDRSFIALGATGTERQVWFDQEEITTLEAVAIVGGLSDTRADLKGLLILRDYPAKDIAFDGTGPEKQQVVFVFDLTSADGLFAAKRFVVNPDDVVVASESPVTSIQTIFGLIGRVVGLNNAIRN